MIAISLFYGLVAGIITITAIILGFTPGNDQHAFSSVWLGYLVMLVALSLIFFGTKRFRGQELGGVITFWRALGLGLLIALVAGLVYVLVWELYLAATGYNFMSNYVAAILEQKTADGLSGTALATEAAALADLEKNYQNPLFRIPLTFLEIFPVGLIVALISSALLRNPNLRHCGPDDCPHNEPQTRSIPHENWIIHSLPDRKGHRRIQRFLYETGF